MQIPEIRVQNDMLINVNNIFDYSLNIVTKSSNDIPTFNLGFYGSGNNITQRMITSEDHGSVVFFVKNVPLEKKQEYRRSTYAIIKRRLLYVHFQSGYIFSDLLDFAFLYDMSSTIYFVHNGISYNKIHDIYNRDPSNYKSNTRIFLLNDNTEIPNDLEYYTKFVNKDVKLVVGYYVAPQDIKYLHVVDFNKKRFSNYMVSRYELDNQKYNPEFIVNVVNHVFNDVNVEKNADFINKSLYSLLINNQKEQGRRFYIAWFIAEILYNGIFNDF